MSWLRKMRTTAALLLAAAVFGIAGCGGSQFPAGGDWPAAVSDGRGGAGESEGFSFGTDETSQTGVYTGDPYETVNGNVPYFTEEELAEGKESFEYYSELDRLGRCGVAFASVGQDLMPTEARESISQIKPSGWQTARYDIVDGGYLYNRCHLIGYQLTAENANEKNLITGTRYMNVEGMLPFENMTADYVKETGNHVLYRATPVFSGTELVARGVELEALSVEDSGDGVCFHVYCYNNQPGITIDYATGDSWLSGTDSQASGAPESGSSQSGDVPEEQHYILNTSSKKFHRPDCSGVANMSPSNRQDYTGTRQSLLDQGYSPCGTCNP